MIKISYATENDAYTLAYIHVNSWKSTYKNIIPDEVLEQINIEKRMKYFQKVLHNKSEENVIIYRDGNAAGFMTFGKCRDDDRDNTFGEIWGIYLLEEYWRQGIGSQLINWGIRTLSNEGYKTICLWVLEKNYSARGFYEKQGFTYDGSSKEIIIGKPLIERRYMKVIEDVMVIL